ncbi:hypothetical protein ACTWPB_06825 [Nocardia sp. IBHARD005]|uniref:hypothetical protein n=1 Tax=Nocardia sp. IBHARD005 TaxID=3457765 RepID=UPI004059B05F
MTANTEAAVVAVLASIGVLALVVAVLESDAVLRAEDHVHRLRLSPADRVEYDALQAELDRQATEQKARAKSAKAADRAKFRPDLVVTVTDREVTDLSDFTVSELLAEITECKRLLRLARELSYNSGRADYAPVQVNNDQLTALTSEYQERAWWPNNKQLSRLDRKRLAAATEMIHDRSEWPPMPDIHISADL